MVDTHSQHTTVFSKTIQELIVDLPRYEEKVDQGKQAVFYQIIVKLGNRQWELSKRFSQFDKLDADLRAKYPQIPKLPGKTFFKLKHNDDLKKRREELHHYLQDLVNRPDLRTNEHFREFLELDTQIPESVVHAPVKFAELPELNLGGRDFVLCEEERLLFVAQSDMNIASRLDSYLTNISLPWDKKDKKQATDSYSSVGALVVYRVNVIKDQAWTFDKMWTRTFASQTNVLHWNGETETLYVGLDNGKIYQFKVPKEYNYMRYQEFDPIQVHTKRVMGISADKSLNHIYSISEDSHFKVTDMTTFQTINDFTSGSSGLKTMCHNQVRGLFIIGDADGVIYIYNQNSMPMDQLCRIQSQAKSCIRGMCQNNYGNYLVAGAVDGSLSVFDLGPPRHERFTKQVAHFQGKPGCRLLAWREQNKEIISANQDGFITVWSAKEGTPIYVLQAHGGPITQMIWLEDRQLLLTCSKDKKIKVWQLPAVWYDEEEIKRQLREYQEKLIPKEQQIIIQQQNKKSKEIVDQKHQFSQLHNDQQDYQTLDEDTHHQEVHLNDQHDQQVYYGDPLMGKEEAVIMIDTSTHSKQHQDQQSLNTIQFTNNTPFSGQKPVVKPQKQDEDDDDDLKGWYK